MIKVFQSTWRSPALGEKGHKTQFGQQSAAALTQGYGFTFE